MLQIDISNIEDQELLEAVNSQIQDLSNFEILLIFKSDYSQSKLIRNLILNLFERNNINNPWKSRFWLVADELVNNSIEYWSLPLDKNIFYFKFNKNSDFVDIIMEVHDTGRWAFGKKAIDMEKIRQEKELKWFNNYLWKRWRGLFFLVKNVADKLSFMDKDKGGLIVRVDKRLVLDSCSN